MSQFLLYNIKELMLNKLSQHFTRYNALYIPKCISLQIEELYTRTIFNRTFKINFIQKFVKRNSSIQGRMRNFTEHPVGKGEKGGEEERGLKVEGGPLGANESSRQAIPNGWKDMQMRARETAGNACLPGRNNH